MEFFKQRRIKQLIIKVAKYKALAESSIRFTRGDTSSVFIDDYHHHVGALAEAQAELLILTNGE